MKAVTKIFFATALASFALLMGSCKVYNTDTNEDLSRGIDTFALGIKSIIYQTEGKWKQSLSKKEDIDAINSTITSVKTSADFGSIEKYAADQADQLGIEKWNKSLIFFSNLKFKNKIGPAVTYLYFSDNKTYIFAKRAGEIPFTAIAKGSEIPANVTIFLASFEEKFYISENNAYAEEDYFVFRVGETKKQIATMNFALGCEMQLSRLNPAEVAYCRLLTLITNAMESVSAD